MEKRAAAKRSPHYFRLDETKCAAKLMKLYQKITAQTQTVLNQETGRNG